MIIKVKVEEQIYEVEISDIRQRPIIAIVEGDEFEIWPEGEPSFHTRRQSFENNTNTQARMESSSQQPVFASSLTSSFKPEEKPLPTLAANGNLLVVRAPIPGVITAVNIHPGEEVSVGQQLCVLEAMKMNNSIRASRAGHIAAVHVIVGQHVKHHDILLEFAA
jgi:glutaconyl-CoA/methylmalonyl-CoA decarboxylase subunit gamma